MRRVLVFLSRLRAFAVGRRLDADFHDELQAHLALAMDDHERRGMSPVDAARQARLRLGGVTQIEEANRDHRSLPQMETTMQDLRFALRTLRKHPGFSTVAALTLALGIGATTSMFSVLHAVLIKPLPYAQPDRLVEIFETNPLKHWVRNVASAANYADWRRMNTVFTDVAATNGSGARGEGEYNVFLTGTGEPQRLKALQVTGNLFQVLGAGPLIGRTFTDEETYDGHQRVVILSYGMWRSLFAGDPGVLGREITLNGRTFTVVGVMPAAFFYPSHDIQLWMPVGYKHEVFTTARRPHWLRVVARLKPGVSLERANDDMTSVAAQLENTYPDTNTKMGVRLESLHAAFAFDARPALLVLFAAVGTVFLIVCVNVANLQLGRAAGRVREIAIRRALGASRARLVRQLVTEGVVLAAVGGALGLLLAIAGKALLVRLAASSLPLFADLTIDRTVIAFDVILSLLAPIVFGLAPAIASSRAEALGDRSDTGAPRSVTRNVLVVAEVALAVVLVVAAGLLVRSLVLLERVDPGFSPEHAMSFRVQLSPARYSDDKKLIGGFQEIEGRLRAQPGIESVGVTTTLPLGGFTWTGDTTVEGRGPTDYERELRHEAVTPGYFATLGTRLLAGRWLNDFDRTGGPNVTLANETLARKYFRGESAVGKRISFGKPTDKPDWVTIVGIVADLKQDGLDEVVQPEVYVPLTQEAQNPMTFVVRSRLEPDVVLALARAQVRAFDKDLVPTDAATLDSVVHTAVDGQRFRTWLLGGFAGLALLLAALGIYGVLAYFVTQRVRELGIRLALGAPPAQLWRMVIGQGMRPVLWGSVIGLAVAFGVTSLMKSLLFGIAPVDPVTYVFTAGALALIGAIACAVPAARAVRVDPLVALRQD